MDARVRARLKNCRLLVTDVDGVMTDGCITYSSVGEELKSFHIQDGLGLKLVQNAGVQTAIITGRNSAMVERRAKELGINHLIQGREDKALAFGDLCKKLDIDLQDCVYLGDDLPDLKAVIAAGVGAVPLDAHPILKKHADYCCHLGGGQGAVREICELILDAKGLLNNILADYGAPS